MNITSAVDQLRTAARKDPRKAGTLALLVAVMGVMWVRALVRTSPAPAAAASVPGAAVADPTPAGGPAGAGAVARAPDKPRADWSVVAMSPASRNLFLVDYTRFEKSGRPTAAGSPTQQAGAETGAKSQKSGPSPADLMKERQILVANLQSQATQLKLQTIVTGAEPRALVNGSLVGEGDVVASFRVVRITARGITVEREGIKFDVSMK